MAIANAMLIIRTMLEIKPPAATSVSSRVKICHAPFFNICNPTGIHILKIHLMYIQLKECADKGYTESCERRKSIVLKGTKIQKPGKEGNAEPFGSGTAECSAVPSIQSATHTETGCRIVKPNRKEDPGKDRMYRGAELAAVPRTGGTLVRPCPTPGTPLL